jgi:hypothetical protein
MSNDPVHDLRFAMQDCRFEEALALAAKVDWKSVSKNAEKGDVEALTAVSQGAELSDYVGDFPAARRRLRGLAEAAEERLRLLVENQQGLPGSLDERRILKRWVWVLMQTATADYRLYRLDRAMLLLALCEAAVLQSIRIEPSYMCWGTLSRIEYGIGLVHREGFDYAAAKVRFLKSIESAWQSLRQKYDKGAQEGFRQSRWTDFAFARALALGLGFVYHAEGQAELALPLLLSARNLLARFDEKRIKAYVDLIYFDARRSGYGADSLVIDDSIEGLKRCRNVFIDENHGFYRARSNYSLSLAYCQRAREDESVPLSIRGDEDLKQAEYYANELAQHGRQTGDSRAELYAAVCMSRIERKRNRFTEAERLATLAIEAAGMHPHLHVGALIARAETRLRQEKTDEAIKDFLDAKDRSGSNLRARAICVLRVVQIYARTNRSHLASQFFDQWREIKPHISNTYISRLERSAIAAMENASIDFVIRMTDDRLDPVVLERRLRGFLVEWAYRQTRRESDEKAAKLLGISRQTLANWRAAAKSAGSGK